MSHIRGFKIFLAATAYFIIAAALMAQAPASFKYQAVLRDARGNIKANTDTKVKVEILTGGVDGSSVYNEDHELSTDNFGLINLEIGRGKSGSGKISDINWGNGNYFVRISIDGTVMGTSQLLSVPYALYAERAGNGFSGDYNDLANKPTLIEGTWPSITGKPAFSNVAISGDFNDLLNKPVLSYGTVTNVSAVSPLKLVNGTTTPNITIAQAGPATNGYLNSTDWTTFNNKSSFDGTWSGLSGKPTLAPVATSGSYNDLSETPAGINAGDMKYWDGTKWVNLAIGQPGQYLQLSASNIPVWTGDAFPTASGTEVSSVTQSTAVFGGTINDNGSDVITKGVCYSTKPLPAITDARTAEGSGPGTFSSLLTGLSPATTYYARIYSVTSAGVTYGPVGSFTTLQALNTTPWQVADSISFRSNCELIGCNDNYIFLRNQTNDTVFVLDVLNRNLVTKKAIAVTEYSVVKDNVVIIPLSEYSFSAYNVSDISNWSLINTFTGLDQGILYWQFYSSAFDDRFYYWIGHWARTVQMFEVSGNNIIAYNKFDVGVNSQSISRLGSSLYVANNYGNNRKFDISNLSAPVNNGDFGNRNTNSSGAVDAGYIIQNYYAGWGGGSDNIKIYNTNNSLVSTFTGSYVGGSMFHTFRNGYCIINVGSAKVYNVKNGSFEYVSDLQFESPYFNDKYIIGILHGKIYLVNKPI